MDYRVIASVLLLFVLMRSIVHSTYINEFVASIEGGTRVANRLAEKYGFINVGEMENFPNHYVFHHRAVQKRSARPSTGDHSRIKHEAAVKWIEQQVIRKRIKRDTSSINDPRYRLQWYLNRKDAPNMNVEAAWDMGITGEGVVVSILDDGLDYLHPDLAKNYDPRASYDINSNDDDPMPRANYDQTNRHGTRCAGEVAMEAGNGICGVGVAYNASIGGIRMLDDEVTDSVEARSLAIHRNYIDIYSSSWGPEDNGTTVDGPGRLAKKAFEDGVQLGREGKGSIFVWASGNGGRAKDSCGCDGYTNSIYTISVSSTSERGEAPWYLEECASTLATTYSSGSPKERKVITTDLLGRCTNDHTGTSASAPLAAGLCALALQANPNLTWRDLQYIIVMTSRRTNLQDSNWFVNGAGYSVSYLYGFGLMDAGAMVQLARNWINLPEQRKCVKRVDARSREINGHGVMASFTLNMTNCASPVYLEHVQASISATFSNRGALVITLVSPSGTQSRLLARRPRDKKRGSFSNWPFMSTHFWGETARGVWTLLVENGLPRANWGRFHKWELTLYGTDSVPSTVKPQFSSKSASEGGSDIGPSSSSIIPIKADTKIKVEEHSLAAIPRSSEYFGPCHRECFNGCKGPLATDCFKCLHYRDRETNECIEHCPRDGFYDPPQRHTKCKACHPTCRRCSGPTAMDCLSCAVDLFLMESRSECVIQCDDEGFYADTKTNTCKQCSALCSRCNSESSCTVCKPHAVLNRNTCVRSCSVNEYMQGNECFPCSSSCYTCNGEGQESCLSCLPGEVLKDRECVPRWLCTDGYYIRDGLGDHIQECIRCHVTCKTCSGPSSSDCMECDSGRILLEGACVPNCLEGYYKDSDGYCMSCDVGCDQCSSATNCLKCTAELVLVQGFCKQGCREGTYEYEGHCRPCHSICETCIGGRPDECTKCVEDIRESRYLIEGACVPFCPDGLYGDTETLQCSKCDETCRTCNGSKINNCLSCFSGFNLTNNACRELEGSHCDSKCKRCLEGSSDRCSSCNKGLFLLNVDCVSTCPSQYFTNAEENECQPCHPSCKTCSGTSSQDCMSCQEGQFLFDGSTCDSHCPYSTYPDSTTGTCKECDPTCLSCSGPGNEACETCEGDRFWNASRCLQTCPAGMYGDIEERQCMKCFPTCQTCDGPFSIDCVACMEGLTLAYGSCISSTCSSPSTYKASDGTCNDCHASCLTCYGPQPTQCLTCEYDHFLNFEGQCIIECVSGFYRDYESNRCRPCHSSCLSCVQGGPQDCMDCQDDKYILSNEHGMFCVENCPSEFYGLQDGPSEDISKICQKCSPQCLDCSDSYSHCLTCRDNTFLYRDQCIAKCPRGFFGDVESNRCIAENRLCPLNCRICDQWGECQDCDGGYHLYYGECMHRPCNKGQYQALDASGNYVCRLCTANCKLCLGPRVDECLGCEEHFHLSNGHCIQECTSNQFAKGNVCYACHPSCATCRGSSPYDCMSCPEGTLSIHSGECSVGCPQGTFLDRDSNQCVRCYNSCRTCEGPGDNKCLSCKHNYYLTGNQKCVPTCPDGSYHYRMQDSTTNFECRPCHSSCQTCYGPSASECVTCHENMYRLDHKCVAHCGTGYYPGSGICQHCHADCKSCWGAEQNKCITCADGKKLVDDHCEDECPQDRYLSDDYSFVCERCHPRCETCDDMGPFNCLSCPEGYRLENKVCYSRCDSGFYFINDNQTCNACHSMCKECFGPTDKQCIDCHSDQHLFSKDTEQFTCVNCCKEGQNPDKDNCCNCIHGMCTLGHVSNPNPPELHGGTIVFFCILAVAVFVLFFGLLQARSHKMLCWKNSYDKLSTFYNNKEEPQITLRQNVLPISDEDDYFEDDDSDF